MVIEIVNNWIDENDYPKRVYGSSPKVIIIGEHHQDIKGAGKQVQLISQLKLDSLLHEFARNYIYDFVQRCVYMNPQYPTSKAAITFAIKAFKSLDTSEFSESFKEWLKRNSMSCYLNPYELAWHALDLSDLSGPHLAYSSLTRILNELPVSLTTIIGCDFSFSEVDLYEEKNKVDLYEKNCLGVHHRFREERFGNVIGEYAIRASSLVVAVVGAYHIRPKSYLHQSLKKKGVEYICIDQSR